MREKRLNLAFFICLATLKCLLVNQTMEQASQERQWDILASRSASNNLITVANSSPCLNSLNNRTHTSREYLSMQDSSRTKLTHHSLISNHPLSSLLHLNQSTLVIRRTDSTDSQIQNN